jgi:hypothetical protein
MVHIVCFYLAIGTALASIVEPTRKNGDLLPMGEAAVVRVAFAVVWLPLLAAIIVTESED